MLVRYSTVATVITALLAAALTSAQTPTPTPPEAPPPQVKKPMLPSAPPPTLVAATVNGQPVTEMAVFRAAMQEGEGDYAEVRKEVLNFLIDNAVIDQYVKRFNMEVTEKEIDVKVDELREDAKKEKQNFDDLLKLLHLNMTELRTQLEYAIRWEKFVAKQATEETLKGFFEKNRSLFDGSQVSARHILVSVKGKTLDEAKTKATQIRQQIATAVTQELTKLPASTDNLGREKERTKLLEKTFAEAAIKESDCPSKEDGGNLGYFPRSGAMVEPFARAAFGLKAYEMSDVVATNFGYHVILATDHKAGKEVNYEELQPVVLHFYSERLREAIIRQYKPQAQVVVHPFKQW